MQYLVILFAKDLRYLRPGVGREHISLTGSGLQGSLVPQPLDENGNELSINDVNLFQRFLSKNFYLTCGIVSGGVYHGRCWTYLTETR